MNQGPDKPSSYSYHEPATALSKRIRSHARYSTFNLHEWIDRNFHLAKGDRVFDLGCGNGNYTELFWKRVGPTGEVVGIDKNPDLINEAQTTHAGLPHDRVRFKTANFDDPFPFAVAGGFEWIFAIYSIYYTEDSGATLDQVQASLARGGRFVVIGPGALSGSKLDEINLVVTGKQPSAKNLAAVKRIETEFFPMCRERFGAENVTIDLMSADMLFPTPEEFAEYYWSTLIWRESTGGRSAAEVAGMKARTIEAVGADRPIVIDKQLACLVASNQ